MTWEMYPQYLETSSGTSHTGKSHCYYICGKCKRRIPPETLERVVISSIDSLSEDKQLLKTLPDEANWIIGAEVPNLKSEQNKLFGLKKLKNEGFERIYEDSRKLRGEGTVALREKKGEQIAAEISDQDKQIQRIQIQIDK